jgi:UDP-glucose 4-epimerase
VRYLITGGAGFIGSHLAERLLSDGHEVAVIDDLSTGSITNIKHLKSNERFQVSIESIMNVPHLAALIDETDAVFHLAAAVGVRRILEDPVQTIITNIRGTEIVLQLAEKKSKKVLITSTSEVYGKSTQIPFREDGDLVLGSTMRPRWSYACSKAIDEFLALAYGSARDVPIVIARLFNTVGPRQTGRYGMVVPRFVGQGLAGEPITVYGDGSQSRCFCHVTDVADALARLISTPEAEGGVFNIGSREEITMETLAQRVRERTGARSEIVHIPFHEAYDPAFEDMQRRVPDITKAGRVIGFEPTRDLNQILDDVIADMRSGEPR